jgi:XapX domain-containing protein
VKIYVLSLFAGILVGVIYSLLNVRSPAPPMVALIGLFAILDVEEIIHNAMSIMAKEPAVISWLHQVKPHVFGHMPVGQSVAERKNAKQNNDT